MSTMSSAPTPTTSPGTRSRSWTPGCTGPDDVHASSTTITADSPKHGPRTTQTVPPHHQARSAEGRPTGSPTATTKPETAPLMSMMVSGGRSRGWSDATRAAGCLSLARAGMNELPSDSRSRAERSSVRPVCWLLGPQRTRVHDTVPHPASQVVAPPTTPASTRSRPSIFTYRVELVRYSTGHDKIGEALPARALARREGRPTSLPRRKTICPQPRRSTSPVAISQSDQAV
jgi:hypothetical protein